MGNNAPGWEIMPRDKKQCPGMGNNAPPPLQGTFQPNSIDAVSIADPGCSSRIRILIFAPPGSRGVKKSPDPDPQICFLYGTWGRPFNYIFGSCLDIFGAVEKNFLSKRDF
jgi:hypothetical protein